MGRYSVGFMAQGAIRSPIDVNVQERKVAILLCLHGKLNIPVKAIQMFKESLQLFWSVWPDDKSVIHITKPAQRFVCRLFQGPLLEVIRKEVRDDRGERGTNSHKD